MVKTRVSTSSNSADFFFSQIARASQRHKKKVKKDFTHLNILWGEYAQASTITNNRTSCAGDTRSKIYRVTVRPQNTVWGKIFNIYCLGRLSSIRVENILIFMSFVRQKSIPRHFLSIFEKYQLTTFWNSKIVNNILTEKLAFLNHYQSCCWKYNQK